MAWYGTVWPGMAWHGTAWHGKGWQGSAIGMTCEHNLPKLIEAPKFFEFIKLVETFKSYFLKVDPMCLYLLKHTLLVYKDMCTMKL